MVKADFRSLGGVPLVTLLVGPSKTSYHIHSSLLFDSSPVFKAAFSKESNFKEREAKSMTLPDENIGAIDRMVQWLYTGIYHLTPYESREKATERYWELAKLNVLADKYDIKKLKNNIIDQLYDNRNASGDYNAFPPPFSVVFYIYENTSEYSSFRKLMIGWLVWHLDCNLYKSDKTYAQLLENGELAADLAMGLGQRLAGSAKDPFNANRAVYYKDYDAKVKGDDADN